MSQAARVFSLTSMVITMLGCAQLSQLQSKSFVDQEFDPPVGASVELTEALLVPPGRLDGWFDQASNPSLELSLASLLELNRLRNEMRCGMRLAKLAPRSGEGVQIDQGVFTVVRVVRESSPLGIDPATASMHGNFATDVTLAYRIDLKSSEQPQVASLYCRQRYANLTRQDTFPNATVLKQQAGSKLVWSTP